MQNTTVKIEGLPLDNKIYVIVSYEGISKNYSFSTDIPTVAISLGIVEGNKLIKNILTCIVGVPELSIVRIGTIWKNQTRLDGYWTEYSGYVEDMQLTFDLKKRPATISRCEKKNKALHLINFSEQDIYKNENSYYGTTFVEFKSETGISYIVPSIELFMSTYLPRNKLIRNELLLYPIDTIVTNYVNEQENNGAKYKIDVDKRYEEETMIFLAYLSCNKKTKENLSKIWTNMAKDSQYNLKQLIALPYHPCKISFKASGVWLNKKTFYIQRINKPKPPSEIPVELILKKNVSVPDNTNNTTSSSKEKNKSIFNNASINKETKISHEKNPNATVGVKHIVSEVSPDNSNINLEITEEIENIIDDSNSYSRENTEVDDASSGKLRGDKGSEKTARTKYIVKENVEVLPFSEETIQALTELTKGPDPKIRDLKYIDDYAKEHDWLTYVNFNASHIGMSGERYWASGYVRSSGIKRSKSGYRKLLIFKITIEGVNSFYLLDIVKKTKSDSFFGIIFQPSYDIDFNLLENIKNVIASNKGHFDGKNILPFPVKRGVKFRHKWGAMKQRFENLFYILKEKKTLIE